MRSMFSDVYLSVLRFCSVVCRKDRADTSVALHNMVNAWNYVSSHYGVDDLPALIRQVALKVEPEKNGEILPSVTDPLTVLCLNSLHMDPQAFGAQLRDANIFPAGNLRIATVIYNVQLHSLASPVELR